MCADPDAEPTFEESADEDLPVIVEAAIVI